MILATAWRMIVLTTLGVSLAAPVQAAEVDAVSGLVRAPGFETVKTHCTVCHSGRLIAQSRADRDGWIYMIRWMQRTQNLWPLGDNESIILDYLETHYSAQATGRRKPIASALLPIQ